MKRQDSAKVHLWVIVSFFLWLFSCAQSEKFSSTESTLFLIPLGQNGESAVELEVLNNGILWDYSEQRDSLGNSWAVLPANLFSETSEITIRYRITPSDFSCYPASGGHESRWLETNTYIDWRNPAIMAALDRLDLSGLTRAQSVRKIGQFVQDSLQFDMEYTHNAASIPASQSLNLQKGVCINFSRLFTALCRGAGIPSRTVSGLVRNHEALDSYDFHHEWMEYQNEEGYWQPLDLTYCTSYSLNDLRYMALVRGAEDHSWFSELDNLDLKSGQPLQLENGNIVLFHYHPIFPAARYGFQLVDSVYQESYTIEKKITIINRGRHFRIVQFCP